MATKTNSMFRISQLAKDLGIKPKDLVAKLEGIGISVKSTSATLEEGDVNALFASMTDGARIHDLDGYLHGKTSITLPESPEEKSKREAAEKAEADRIKAEAEAKRKAEEEAKRRAEEEARKKAEEEARRRAEEEARKKAEEEARIRAEEEARRKAEEEARIRAEEEARKKAEEEARIRAEEEARRKAEEERIKAEEDARLKAEAEARAKAEAAEKEKTTDRPQRPQNTQRDGANRNQNTNYQQNRTGNGQPQRDNRGPAGASNQRTDRPYGDRNTGDRPAGDRPNTGDRPYNNDRYNQNRPQNGQQGQSRPFGQNNQQRPQRDSVPRDKDSGNDRAPIAPQPKPKIEQGVERKRTGQTRVVDTRTTSVDLSKYDERLDNFSPEIDDKQSNKQKLKKQNQRGDNRGTGRKSDKERFAMDKMQKANLEKAKKQPLKVTIPDEISVGELAQRLKITAAECVKKLMLMGMMATVNQIIDFDTAYLIADELGAEVTREVTVTIEDKLFNEEPDTEENLEIRAPIVCVMGHVDHGKTSILDAIRHTNVTSGEAGGITQHIGAYRVQIDGRDITFLDTPGHEAFTAMRARGAQCTDIAILVVAGDDGIMPQTVEAINHAKAAGVDIIVAINKMDKPTANADAVMTELTKYELVPEEWCGDVMCFTVSAHTRMGITDLLEDVLLIADVKEYKANPHKRAKGVVIEAKLDKGRGPVATVLVQDGTLRAGDIVIAGTSVGRVRAMTNDRGQQLQEAGPSVPVEIIGLSEVPLAGDEFNAVEDERMARELADQRKEKAKEEQFKLNAKVSLDDLFSQIAAGVKELNVIVKADVGGSAEAVKASLEKISTEEVRVRVIHSAVGGITESDVTFAAASNAIIVGFNVRPGKGALYAA
ncbi:MAG: translation initiation factor IF-2 [Clostridia bacterium]|nr:translation initiation factor IF-2 [Clostridia bacterium]